MAASAASCAHCGEEGVELKRCLRCKQASYCGAECQLGGWEGHKRTCVHIDKVHRKVSAADEAHDWRGVLQWEGRVDELLEGQADDGCEGLLSAFKKAHQLGFKSTGCSDHALSVIRLDKRRVELLGQLQRFRDQSSALCSIGEHLNFDGQLQESATYFQRARDLGAAHGFFSAECRACSGLGAIAMKEGRHEEGLELLRNTLAAAPLNESDDSTFELNALQRLTRALFETHGIDEVEGLVPRYREAAQAESRRGGRPCYDELNSIYATVRLHEARGRPHEAEREVRALLDLLRENRAAVQDQLFDCSPLLEHATDNLKILDLYTGKEDLIKCWALELSKLFGE